MSFLGDNSDGGDNRGDNSDGGDNRGDNSDGGDNRGDNSDGGDNRGDNSDGGDYMQPFPFYMQPYMRNLPLFPHGPSETCRSLAEKDRVRRLLERDLGQAREGRRLLLEEREASEVAQTSCI